MRIVTKVVAGIAGRREKKLVVGETYARNERVPKRMPKRQDGIAVKYDSLFCHSWLCNVDQQAMHWVRTDVQ